MIAMTAASPTTTTQDPKLAANAPNRASSANDREPAGSSRAWLRSRSKPIRSPAASATMKGSN